MHAHRAEERVWGVATREGSSGPQHESQVVICLPESQSSPRLYAHGDEEKVQEQ